MKKKKQLPSLEESLFQILGSNGISDDEIKDLLNFNADIKKLRKKLNKESNRKVSKDAK